MYLPPSLWRRTLERLGFRRQKQRPRKRTRNLAAEQLRQRRMLAADFHAAAAESWDDIPAVFVVEQAVRNRDDPRLDTATATGPTARGLEDDSLDGLEAEGEGSWS